MGTSKWSEVRGVPPLGSKNFLSPKFLKKKFRLHTVASKRKIHKNFSILRLCPQVGGGLPPQGNKNFPSQKFLKKNSKSNTNVKTLNVQNFFDSESMTDFHNGRPRPGGVHDPNFFSK